IFPRRLQVQLDRWSAGELSEYEFLVAVDWSKTWGGDAELYLPLLRYARQAQIPLLALNVERALIRKVAQRGFADLPDEEREGIWPPVKPSEAYEARLLRAYEAHGRGGATVNEAAFLRFVESQLTWDRAMAQAIAERKLKQPTHLIVAIV